MDNQLITIIYKTSHGKRICVEVSTNVKELLEQSDRQIRTQGRQDRRYLADEQKAMHETWGALTREQKEALLILIKKG